MGKCFYGFTSAGAFAIWMSWYPWHLQNVYLPAEDCKGARRFSPSCGVSQDWENNEKSTSSRGCQ